MFSAGVQVSDREGRLELVSHILIYRGMTCHIHQFLVSPSFGLLNDRLIVVLFLLLDDRLIGVAERLLTRLPGRDFLHLVSGLRQQVGAERVQVAGRALNGLLGVVDKRAVIVLALDAGEFVCRAFLQVSDGGAELAGLLLHDRGHARLFGLLLRKLSGDGGFLGRDRSAIGEVLGGSVQTRAQNFRQGTLHIRRLRWLDTGVLLAFLVLVIGDLHDLTAFLVGGRLFREGDALAERLQLHAVVLGGAAVVLHRDLLLVEVVLLEELAELLVATQGHDLELVFEPCVHGKAAHVRDALAQVPVLGGAVHAYKRAVVNRGPLRLGVGRAAIEADRVVGVERQLLEH